MTEGLLLCSPLSCIISDMFIDKKENQILNNKNIKINILLRYVDDIFIIRIGNNNESIKLFHEYINNTHHHIKFTIELELNISINFLDLKPKNTTNLNIISTEN